MQNIHTQIIPELLSVIVHHINCLQCFGTAGCVYQEMNPSNKDTLQQYLNLYFKNCGSGACKCVSLCMSACVFRGILYLITNSDT